jgi:hypothetical protein
MPAHPERASPLYFYKIHKLERTKIMLTKHSSSIGAVVAHRILEVIDRNSLAARIARKPGVVLTTTVVQSIKVGLLLNLAGGGAGQIVSSRKPALAQSIADAALLVAAGGLAYTQRLQAERGSGPVDEIDLLNRPGPVPIWPKKGDPTAVVFRVPYGRRGLNWEKRSRQVNGYPVTALKLTGLLGSEYHFHGQMSNWEAVQIAAGLQPAHQTRGYVGAVSGTEKLSPGWALLKRRLIEAALAAGPELKPSGQRLNSLDQVRLSQEIMADLGLKPGDLVVFMKNEAGRWEIWTEEAVLEAWVEVIIVNLNPECPVEVGQPTPDRSPERLNLDEAHLPQGGKNEIP